MDKSLIVESIQQFCRLVGGVVIYHDHIELEVGLLLECTVDSVADGLLTIIDGDDD